MNLKNVFVLTNGTGLWSSKKCSVQIVDMELRDEELKVYFDLSDWDVDQDGFIYTDEGWIKGFRHVLREFGFSAAACKQVGYSEAGMQGPDYVSLDVGEKFVKEFAELNPKITTTTKKKTKKDKHKIDFANRTCRKDGRKKNYYPKTLQGDFHLVMDEHYDNSMGDYNSLWEEFILSLGIHDVRAKFQEFLQNQLKADSDH